jgi:hypothetical protein
MAHLARGRSNIVVVGRQTKHPAVMHIHPKDRGLTSRCREALKVDMNLRIAR